MLWVNKSFFVVVVIVQNACPFTEEVDLVTYLGASIRTTYSQVLHITEFNLTIYCNAAYNFWTMFESPMLNYAAYMILFLSP